VALSDFSHGKNLDWNFLADKKNKKIKKKKKKKW
jgi:hypothetical protein